MERKDSLLKRESIETIENSVVVRRLMNWIEFEIVYSCHHWSFDRHFNIERRNWISHWVSSSSNDIFIFEFVVAVVVIHYFRSIQLKNLLKTEPPANHSECSISDQTENSKSSTMIIVWMIRKNILELVHWYLHRKEWPPLISFKWS